MNTDDRTFVQNKINEQKTALPGALQPEAVTELVRNQTQAKPRRNKTVAWIVSAAAVLLIAVGLTAALHFGALNRAPSADRNAADRLNAELPMQQGETPVQAADYGELGRLIKSNIALMNSGGSYAYNGWRGIYMKEFANAVQDDIMAVPEAAPQSETDMAAMPSQAGDAAEDGDYSKTNTRTEGVDEADIFRTDGKYLYVLNNSNGGGYRSYYGWMGIATERISNPQSFIVADPNGGNLKKTGEYKLTLADEGDKKLTRERYFDGFFLYGDLVVLTGTEMRFTEGELKYYEENGGGYWDVQGDFEMEYLAAVLILDCSDPTDIKPVKELYFDGTLADTRIVENRLITVSSYYPDRTVFNAEDYKTFVPRAGEDGCYIPPENITVAGENDNNYAVISVTDLSDPAFATQAQAVLGAGAQVYCTKNTVYCYGMQYVPKDGDDYDWNYDEFLTVSKADISGLAPKVTATQRFKDISLMDQYALDEYNGYLRMAVRSWASAENRWTDVRNYILVLDGDLNAVGRSESFGADEEIRSVRFMGDKVYVVTFLNTDPLFAFDLSDPAHPVRTGEVKLPGYSAYMHPAGEGYMLGVGYDGTEEGVNGDAKLSLFNVSDPENPVEAERYILKNGSFETDPKAFIVLGDGRFVVLFYRWDYETDVCTCGAVIVTAENGKLQVASEILLPECTSDHKAVTVGGTLYFVATQYEIDNSDGYNHGWKDWHRGLFACDMATGKLLSTLEF